MRKLALCLGVLALAVATMGGCASSSGAMAGACKCAATCKCPHCKSGGTGNCACPK